MRVAVGASDSSMRAAVGECTFVVLSNQCLDGSCDLQLADPLTLIGCRINHHFPLCTAYQLTHGSIDVLPDLGLSKPLHYHPRDQMTDYREDIKKSTGKVSFFIRSADEVAQYKGKSSFNFNVDHHTDGSRKDPPNTLPGFSDAKLARFRGTWKG